VQLLQSVKCKHTGLLGECLLVRFHVLVSEFDDIQITSILMIFVISWSQTWLTALMSFMMHCVATMQ